MAKNEEVTRYIDRFGGTTHERLKQLRELVFSLEPNATERISYKIPAYFRDKTLVIYFAGYERHVSIYPGRIGPKGAGEKLEKYLSGKSTLKFPNDSPFPLDDIKAFITTRLQG